MDLELDGERALVTASSKGLGRAIAAQFLEEGASVAISSRSEENLDAARSALLSSTDADADRVVTVQCDLSSTDEIPAALERGIDELGGLDCLVTNHPGPPSTGFEETSVDDLDRAYESVLKSTFVVVKTCLPHVREARGSITNLVSGSVQEPTSGSLLSNVVRPGLFTLSKSLANEYGDEGVRVNCVCPRGILTERLEYKFERAAEADGVSITEAKSGRVDAIPMDRLGEPDEFARGVVFVASGAASFVNGATLQVDGGWSRDAF